MPPVTHWIDPCYAILECSWLASLAKASCKRQL